MTQFRTKGKGKKHKHYPITQSSGKKTYKRIGTKKVSPYSASTNLSEYSDWKKIDNLKGINWSSSTVVWIPKQTLQNKRGIMMSVERLASKRYKDWGVYVSPIAYGSERWYTLSGEKLIADFDTKNQAVKHTEMLRRK